MLPYLRGEQERGVLGGGVDRPPLLLPIGDVAEACSGRGQTESFPIPSDPKTPHSGCSHITRTSKREGAVAAGRKHYLSTAPEQRTYRAFSCACCCHAPLTLSAPTSQVHPKARGWQQVGGTLSGLCCRAESKQSAFPCCCPGHQMHP